MEIFSHYKLELLILLDAVIATVLGGIIGYEREHKDKPAGLRTNMLVSTSSLLILRAGNYYIDSNLDIGNGSFGIDPTRVIHAIIVGVSFIGAGTVLKRTKENTVKYLTTAASILLAASIGICVGMHLYILSVGIAIMGLIINTLLSKVKEI